MDMEFYWLRCRKNQGHFPIFGRQAQKIKEITRQNTIQRSTTEKSNLNFNTKISTIAPEKTRRTDKIRIKGVLYIHIDRPNCLRARNTAWQD